MPHGTGRHCGPKPRKPFISQSSTATIQGQEPADENRALPLGYSGETPWAVLKSWAPVPIVPDTTAPGQGRQTWEAQGHGMGSVEAKGRVQANSIKSNGGATLSDPLWCPKP